LDRDISEEALLLLLNTVIKGLKNRAIYIEFRNYDDFSAYKSVFEKTGFAYIPRLNFHIKTDCLEQVMSNISASKRKNIRSSIKYGGKIVEITDKNEVREFYKIISNLYKKKIKTPLFDCEFFEKFATLPNVKFFGIKYQGKIIGGSGCVVLKNKSVYEWFKCGIDGTYKHIYPSTLATWAGMEFAVKSNIARYDMMGAGKPDEQSGIRDFKSKFGGKLVEHGRFLYICNGFLYKLGKFYIEKVKI
jgi:lipid II:glycine glycyltransferase (peptidoglycan interpeptide bridge formation enzyme)